MSLSSINSASAGSISSSFDASPMQQRRQDFNALSQALESGDLAGAQKAFSSLTQNAHPSGSQANTDKSTNSPRAADFQQLSQALQSGDLAGAQKAFAALKQDGQNARAVGAQGTMDVQQSGQVHHHHGHHHASANTSAAASSAAPKQNTGPLGNNVDVTA